MNVLKVANSSNEQNNNERLEALQRYFNLK